MRVLKTVKHIRAFVAAHKKAGRRVGFVPTMGCLHDGHMSLVRRAQKENDIVIVSIFVNPLQFGPTEDFSRYPRTEKQDYALCRSGGVDCVYAPHASVVYPKPFLSTVSVSSLTNKLCGAFRKGHFDGVTTVVLKLFNQVLPDRAYFGKKDYQQFRVLERMVKDLDCPVTVRACPIVRESDGLAMSSRNRYLSVEERKRACVLSQTLKNAKCAIKDGERAGSVVERMIVKRIASSVDSIDYVSVCDAVTLEPVKRIEKKIVIALAAHVGKARLIDNIEVSV